VRVAEAALAERQYVTAIDVLVGVGWLAPRRVDEWRQGRVDYLERVVEAGLGNISTAMRVFRRWGQQRGLKPSETGYVARSRGGQPLRFSKSGDPSIERAYRTHWVSPELSGRGCFVTDGAVRRRVRRTVATRSRRASGICPLTRSLATVSRRAGWASLWCAVAWGRPKGSWAGRAWRAYACL
jgi:hypothetical protein